MAHNTPVVKKSATTRNTEQLPSDKKRNRTIQIGRDASQWAT